MLRTVRAWILVVMSAWAGGGCYSVGDGPDPSPTTLYFPVGLAVSPGGTALYAVNSDFDLQFNSGSVQSYDLARLRAMLKPLWSRSADATLDPCVLLGLGPNTRSVVQPGRCGPVDPDAPPDGMGTLVKSSVKIGAFATNILFACHPGEAGGGVDCRGGEAAPGGARLFIPVRGEPSLTFIDVDDDRAGGAQSFRLDCGQPNASARCGDSHRSGVTADDNLRGLTMPAEPFGIALSDDADAIVVTHQSGGGAASLFTVPTGASVLDAKPVLQHVLRGLPSNTTGIAAIPTPALVRAVGRRVANYQPGFALSFRGSPEIDIVRYYDDQDAAPQRPFLVRSSRAGLTATPSGIDSRDVAIDHGDTSARVVCERACAPQDLACLLTCARIPLAAYVANRSPSSLLVGELRNRNPGASTDEVVVYEAEPLAREASRVVIGRIRDVAGQLRTRVFVICFDASLIFVYDPVARRIDGQIRTGPGPHALVMDPVEPIAYVGHFTDSYIGLVDLDQSHAETFQTIVATIGVPKSPRGSK